jgi:hypothetical protein
LQTESGLAASPGPGEGDEPSGPDETAYLGHFDIPPDEACRLCRQVVRQLRVVERAERGELALETFGPELEDLLGAAEVFQPVESEVFQKVSRRQPVPDEAGGGRREKYLTPVGNRGNTSGAMHLETD